MMNKACVATAIDLTYILSNVISPWIVAHLCCARSYLKDAVSTHEPSILALQTACPGSSPETPLHGSTRSGEMYPISLAISENRQHLCEP
jgi:hypothetical protein